MNFRRILELGFLVLLLPLALGAEGTASGDTATSKSQQTDGFRTEFAGMKEKIEWRIYHENRSRNELGGIVGMFDPESRAIILHPDAFKKDREYIILHQLVHVYLYEEHRAYYDSHEEGGEAFCRLAVLIYLSELEKYPYDAPNGGTFLRAARRLYPDEIIKFDEFFGTKYGENLTPPPAGPALPIAYIIRMDIAERIALMAFALEDAKKNNNNQYPAWSDLEFSQRLNSIPGYPYDDIRSSRYETDGATYKAYFILNITGEKGTNFSVVKMVDGSIHWKDNFAGIFQRIDKLKWDQVNHLVDNIKTDSNGACPPGRFNLPTFIP